MCIRLFFFYNFLFTFVDTLHFICQNFQNVITKFMGTAFIMWIVSNVRCKNCTKSAYKNACTSMHRTQIDKNDERLNKRKEFFLTVSSLANWLFLFVFVLWQFCEQMQSFRSDYIEPQILFLNIFIFFFSFLAFEIVQSPQRSFKN